METLLALDRELFLFFNGMHSVWLDHVMLFLTKTLAWLPLYAMLLYLIARDYPKEWWMVLVALALTILIADQVTSGVMKPYFARLRPSHEPGLAGLVHIVNDYRGGKYGFASSHAANTIGTATFLFLVLRDTRRWIGWLFLWAGLTGYTRIYLGVHYPGDVLIGGVIGFLAGVVGHFAFRRMSVWRRRAQAA